VCDGSADAVPSGELAPRECCSSAAATLTPPAALQMGLTIRQHGARCFSRCVDRYVLDIAGSSSKPLFLSHISMGAADPLIDNNYRIQP